MTEDSLGELRSGAMLAGMLGHIKRFVSSERGGVVGNQMKILKKGSAARVIFFYPGEEGTYVDHADVTLYENGIVHIKSNQEETTTHLQNCEILWHFEVDSEERANKVRLLKPKGESPKVEARTPSSDTDHKSPDLV